MNVREKKESLNPKTCARVQRTGDLPQSFARTGSYDTFLVRVMAADGGAEGTAPQFAAAPVSLSDWRRSCRLPRPNTPACTHQSRTSVPPYFAFQAQIVCTPTSRRHIFRLPTPTAQSPDHLRLRVPALLLFDILPPFLRRNHIQFHAELRDRVIIKPFVPLRRVFRASGMKTGTDDIGLSRPHCRLGEGVDSPRGH